MTQLGVKIDEGNNWTDLKLKFINTIVVSSLNATSSTFDIILARETLANASAAPTPPNGIYLLKDIVIPNGASMCLEEIDVRSVSNNIGVSKKDNWTILIRSTANAINAYIKT